MFSGSEENSRFSFGSQQNSQSLSQLSDICPKVEAVVEYEWPSNSGKVYFIEEYLADYLEIKHMKRFYPTLERRRIQSLEEREYLLDNCIVNSLQCDLGVIAIPSEQVYQIIAPHHIKKFEVYGSFKSQKQYGELVNASREASCNQSQRSLINDEELKSVAMKSCSSWNSKLNGSARKYGSSRTYFDSQDACYRRRNQLLPENIPAKAKVGNFPVAVMLGQYVDYVPRYTSEQLSNFPLNTVTRGALVSGNTSNSGTDEDSVDSDKHGLLSPFRVCMRCNDWSSLSGCSCSTTICGVESTSSSSSTVTCSISDFDFDVCSSCEESLLLQ